MYGTPTCEPAMWPSSPASSRLGGLPKRRSATHRYLTRALTSGEQGATTTPTRGPRGRPRKRRNRRPMSARPALAGQPISAPVPLAQFVGIQDEPDVEHMAIAHIDTDDGDNPVREANHETRLSIDAVFANRDARDRRQEDPR